MKWSMFFIVIVFLSGCADTYQTRMERIYNRPLIPSEEAWPETSSKLKTPTSFQPKEIPRVGMTEAELESFWGRGGSSSYYPEYNLRVTWYTNTIIGIRGGYHTGALDLEKYCVFLKNGIVERYLIH